MKVVFITPAYYPNLLGGSERSLKIIAEGLAKSGIKVSVLSFDSEKGKKIEVLNKVKVIRVKKINFVMNTFSQNIALLLNKKLVKNEKPDVIHVYNTWHIPASVILRKIAPVVATLNNYYPLIPTSYTKDNIIESGKLNFFRVMKSIADSVDGNIVKKYFQALIYALYSIPIRNLSRKIDKYIVYADAIEKIYTRAGFDSKKFVTVQSPLEEVMKVSKNKREKNFVLYVGGAYEAKGFYDLIEASKILKNKDIHFYFVGVKNVPQGVKELVKKEGLKVKFVGRVEHDELAKYYSRCSVLVHPSLWPEPFSRVWIESIMTNTPIISSDNPVAKEILQGYALFYRRKKPYELAERIEGFLSGKLKITGKKDKLKKNNEIIRKIISVYKQL